jgi:hypothetical protein
MVDFHKALVHSRDLGTSPLPSLDEYAAAVARNDWFYEWADGPAYSRGAHGDELLRNQARRGGVEYQIIFNTNFAQHFKDARLPFPDASTVGDSGTPKTKQTPIEDNTMKELFAALTAAIALGIQQGLEGINLGGAASTASTTGKAGTTKDTKKPAEAEENEVTMEDLRAASKKAVDAGKTDDIKALLKKAKAEKVTSLKPEQWADFHKKLVALTAEDDDAGVI